MPGVLDIWTWRRERDESRLRQAVAAVRLALLPDAPRSVLVLDGAIRVVITKPWWAPLTMGGWSAVACWRARLRCEQAVPPMIGWHPKIEVRSA